MRKYFVAFLLAPLAALAGCANYASNVAKIQADWPVLEAAVNADVALAGIKIPPAAVNAEAAIDAAVANLSATASPTSVTTVANDIAVLVNALPPNTISAEHKAELDALVATVDVGALLF
jgi:hypothetical protein